jgi:alpha-D-ribose 1-methylphosphonate 5-triphosphate synthase subunit PhnH
MNVKEWWMPDAQQESFRAVLDGFSRPGTLVMVGDDRADAVLVLLGTLLDESISLADTIGRLNADQRRLLLAPSASPAQARFVLANGAVAPAPDFIPSLGTLESPELGATLLLTVADLAATPQPGNTTLSLRGPGIANECVLHVAGLHSEWIARRANWVSSYPLGIDLVLCATDRLVALPRTTRIEIRKD